MPNTLNEREAERDKESVGERVGVNKVTKCVPFFCGTLTQLPNFSVPDVPGIFPVLGLLGILSVPCSSGVHPVPGLSCIYLLYQV